MKYTTLLAIDSDGKRIKPKSPRNEGTEWLHLTKIWRASDIPQQTKTEEGARMTEKADHIMIMVGLNEIRDGKSAMQTYNSLKDNMKPLTDTGKPVSIIEIPPIDSSISQKNEARIFNSLIKRIPKTNNQVTILECWDTLSHYRPADIFEEDKFHLDTSKEGTTEMAKLIIDHNRKVLQQTPGKQIDTETIQIAPSTAQFYIGKQGKH